jgi:hypothetical protein
MFRESLASPSTWPPLFRLEACPKPSLVDEVGRRRSRSDGPVPRSCELLDDISSGSTADLVVLWEAEQGERRTVRPKSEQ